MEQAVLFEVKDRVALIFRNYDEPNIKKEFNHGRPLFP